MIQATNTSHQVDTNTNTATRSAATSCRPDRKNPGNMRPGARHQLQHAIHQARVADHGPRARRPDTWRAADGPRSRDQGTGTGAGRPGRFVATWSSCCRPTWSSCCRPTWSSSGGHLVELLPATWSSSGGPPGRADTRKEKPGTRPGLLRVENGRVNRPRPGRPGRPVAGRPWPPRPLDHR